MTCHQSAIAAAARRFLGGGGPTLLLAFAILILAVSLFYQKQATTPVNSRPIEVVSAVPTAAQQPPVNRPDGLAAGRKQTGSCTSSKRGLATFACPSTPTGDVCGAPPLLYCYQGTDESCPRGTSWDPECSCTCLKAE